MPNVNVVRQTYNVLGAFVSPSPATGFMFTSGTSGGNLLITIPRVQSAGITTAINREDVFEFGQAARLDQVIVGPGDIQATLDYLLIDGYAESGLGFAALGQQTFISGMLDGTQAEKNYFIAIAPEGTDLINATTSSNNINVIGLGNGVISNYQVNLAIGQIPRASITISANNQQTYTGSANKVSPAINPYTALPVVGPTFTIPSMAAYTGAAIVAALRPGDIILSFPRTGSIGDFTSGVGQIHVQAVSISIPMAVDAIGELGNPFPIGRPVRLPVNCTMTIDALVGDVVEDSVAALFCSDTPDNFQISLRNPNCQRQGTNAITYWFNGAKITNRDYSAAIGQNSTVRLTLSNTIGGINGSFLSQGVVVSGSFVGAAFA